MKKTRRAVEFGERIGVGVYVGSGGAVDLPGDCENQGEMIATVLRRMGIDEERIVVEGKAKDTVENILYSLKKIDGTKIGICSNPRHLDRANMIINRGKRGSVINDDLSFYGIGTDERVFDSFYESLTGFMARFSVQDDLSQKEVFLVYLV